MYKVWIWRTRWELRNAGGLEAGKGKGMDSPLELPEGIQTCRYLDFSPWTDFRFPMSRNLR